MACEKAVCATCLAMSQSDMTIEAAHISGFTLGILCAGGRQVPEAQTWAAAHFCEEHEKDIHSTALMVATAMRS